MRQIERPKSLAETVLHRLREAIVEGDLKLGEPLSERQLAEDLGVSKTPVREALAHLKLERLVRIVPQRGAFVFTLSAREVVQLCELRQALETAALRYAIERNHRTFERGLGAVVVRMRQTRAENNVRAYLREDTAYHEQFFRYSGNEYMADAYNLLVGRIAALRKHISVKPHHTERSFEEHERMLETVARGDIEQSLAILSVHIERTKQTYAEWVEDIAAADRRASKDIEEITVADIHDFRRPSGPPENDGPPR